MLEKVYGSRNRQYDKPEAPNGEGCFKIYEEPQWSGVFKVYDTRKRQMRDVFKCF